MFFDIAWPEFMLIAIVALIVIGPKDLPRAMRVAGFWMRKARSLSREFHNSIDQMIREAELDEVRQELKKAAEIDIAGEFHKTLDPDGSLTNSIKPPDLPDYFDVGAGPGAVPALEHQPAAAANGQAIAEVAPEAPLPDGMPEPDFVGFETTAAAEAGIVEPSLVEPAHDAAPTSH